MKIPLVLAIVVPLAFLSSSSALAAPTEDSVSGTAIVNEIARGFTITIDAHSGATGENATGTFRTSYPGGVPFSTAITCLGVTGKTAVIGLGLSGFVTIVDNGSPGAGRDTTSATGAGATGTCTNPPPFPVGPYVVSSGDFVVTDAASGPVSKPQCKDGGWRQYGFNNQGQCVASVAAGPKR